MEQAGLSACSAGDDAVGITVRFLPPPRRWKQCNDIHGYRARLGVSLCWAVIRKPGCAQRLAAIHQCNDDNGFVSVARGNDVVVDGKTLELF